VSIQSNLVFQREYLFLRVWQYVEALKSGGGRNDAERLLAVDATAGIDMFVCMCMRCFWFF
jgi:hypothetical protein